MQDKKSKLAMRDIRQVLAWDEPCGGIATDRITVNGCKNGCMRREEPVQGFPDSGWRFFAGSETDAYLGNAGNSGMLNTICHCDTGTMPWLRDAARPLQGLTMENLRRKTLTFQKTGKP